MPVPTPEMDPYALKNQVPALAEVGGLWLGLSAGNWRQLVCSRKCTKLAKSWVFYSVAGNLGQASFLTYKIGIRISTSEGCSEA